MQKLLGTICVISGFIGMGYSYMEKESQKIIFIEMWDYVLSLFLNEIAYKKQSLAYATYEIGQRLEGREGACFRRIYERMQDHNRKAFSEIWMDEWGIYLKGKKNYVKEGSLIREFINITDVEDEVIMVRMIEEQQEKWRHLQMEIANGQQERKKIVWTLSICFGLMLILILL